MSADGTSSPAGLMIKIVALAVVAAVAVWAALPLIGNGNWIGLIILTLVTALIFYIYLSPHTVPMKYLIPGTLFLIVFQIIPVGYTVSTAFTNFGDAHRGSREQAIAAIEGASVTQVPDSPVYTLTIATDGNATSGDIVFLLADPEAYQSFVGTSEGLEELPAGDVQRDADGKITEATGYTVLSIAELSARNEDVTEFSVPTDQGTIENQGLSRAFEGTPLRAYDEACECITDSSSGEVWTADGSVGSFVNDAGDALAQGWKVNVGLEKLHQGPRRRDAPVVVPEDRDLELRLRHRRRLDHVRAGTAGRDRPQQGRAARAADLPVADHPSVRHAGGRDDAGLAGHVQHGLRVDQPPAGHGDQLVRQYR
jgi:arabinogalactan oligomer/maltooligosaccharide transport system permease protein